MNKGINSRKKGGRNERKVARLFEIWTGKEFARTPSSGGLRWKQRDDVVGDIVCTEQKHNFPFSVETKFHKEINFEHLITAPKHVRILDFWDQACRDAERSRKTPLVLMRYNGMESDQYFTLLPTAVYREICKEYEMSTPILEYSSPNPDHSFIIMKSTTLFKIAYVDVRVIARAYNKSHYSNGQN